MIEHLTPKGVDPDLERRSRVLVGALLVNLALSVIIGVASLLVQPQIAATIAVAECMALAILWLVRSRPVLAGYLANTHHLVAVLVVVIEKGGLISSTAGWFPVFVVVARLTMSGRGSALMAAAWAASCYWLAFRVDLGTWDFELHGSPLFYALPRALACLSTYALVSVFEYSREKASEALRERNADMRLLLDNLEQGYLAIDEQGTIGKEHSAVLSEWFGPIRAGERFVDWFVALDPESLEQIEWAWDELRADYLPSSVALSMLPNRLKYAERQYDFSYRLVGEELRAGGLLVLATDITETLSKQRDESVKEGRLAVFALLMKDRTAARSFFAEMNELLEKLALATAFSSQMQYLHTLKGNAALYGLASFSASAHELETRALEDGELGAEQVNGLERHWNSLCGQMSTWLHSENGQVQLSELEFSKLEEAIAAELSHPQLLRLFRSFRHEDLGSCLERFAEQARQLAARLEKGQLKVEVQANGLRLERLRWQPFWAVFSHLIRNMVDHGVQSTAERRRLGKSGPAILRLSAEIEGEHLVVRAGDDGPGIDWQTIAAKGRDLGLAAETQADREALLFAEGFSTKVAASETSGRGLGMPTLSAAVNELRGRIQVHSTKDVGTEFTFRIPLSAELAPVQTEEGRGCADVA